MLSPNQESFDHDQVPEHFKELFIVSGYRSPGSSLSQCFFSVFKATNETLNFWTHFLPAIYFWYLTYHMNKEFDFVSDVYTWPLAAYMIGVCLFPITSAIAHVFNPLSDRARHVCFFMDYAAISIFTMGTSIAYKAYIFPTALINSTFHDMFLLGAAINAVMSLVITCHSRFIENGLRKKLIRASAFAIPYFYVSAPMALRMFNCERSEECDCRSLIPHTYQFIFAMLASVMYISHVPERLFPGTFDIIGHSHQLFHVFTIIAAYLQMNGLTMDMIDRKEELAQLDSIPTPVTSLVLMITVLVVDLFVLRYFIGKLRDLKPGSRVWINLYGNNNLSAGDCCAPKSTKQHHSNKAE